MTKRKAERQEFDEIPRKPRQAPTIFNRDQFVRCNIHCFVCERPNRKWTEMVIYTVKNQSAAVCIDCFVEPLSLIKIEK